MSYQPNSLLISDIIPRPLNLERREANSAPAKQGLLGWSRKYIFGFIVAASMLLCVFAVQTGGSKPLIVNAAAPHQQQQQTTPAAVSFGLPRRLRIPSINVDSAVEHIGLTPQGDMGVPKVETNTAWFDQGPRPGEEGSSVINGHFGLKDRVAGAFDDLRKLQKGDKLYIEDENGKTITFIVREFRTYGPDEDASGVFHSNDGRAHLNLITCQGAWDKTQKSYSSRLVVFSDKTAD